MLVSEEFLLLVTSPEGKWLAASDAVPLALAGGLLAELALQGKVTVDHRDRIVVVDRSSPGDLVLADALSTFAEKEGKKPKDVLGMVAKGLGDRLYDRLAEAGVVEVHKVRLLPVRHFPLRDPAVRQRTWDDVAAVLRGDRSPESRTGTLLGLTVASGAVTRVFPPAGFGLSKRDLEKRARELAESDWENRTHGSKRRGLETEHPVMVTAVKRPAGETRGKVAAGPHTGQCHRASPRPYHVLRNLLCMAGERDGRPLPRPATYVSGRFPGHSRDAQQAEPGPDVPRHSRPGRAGRSRAWCRTCAANGPVSGRGGPGSAGRTAAGWPAACGR